MPNTKSRNTEKETEGIEIVIVNYYRCVWCGKRFHSKQEKEFNEHPKDCSYFNYYISNLPKINPTGEETKSLKETEFYRKIKILPISIKEGIKLWNWIEQEIITPLQLDKDRIEKENKCPICRGVGIENSALSNLAGFCLTCRGSGLAKNI